ncbi:hypothetical protein [Sphingomonas sp. 37zxx]|uniref:hypothetical protein n=1 Tax=Sphingomonas sp. 37zxx TaxID=1550073 RepID=UPI00053BE788|nr:hypothetical protein [Sphingomonas sp. 37zxx]
MKISRTSVAAGALAVLLAPMLLGGGVLSAQDRDAPESLLPPGFDDPAPPPAPAPTPAPGAAPRPGGAVPPPMVQPLPALPADGAGNAALPMAEVEPPAPLTAAELLQYELPVYARRSTAQVGRIGMASGGLAPDSFGDADGVYLEALMRRMEAPVASRWLSIALRRMLLSQLDTPARVNGADFAAERAWLLIRMGEAMAARSVVQGVDRQNFTPKLYQVAMQAALATGDLASLCPLEPFARPTTNEAGWQLAEAMCAALEGEPRRAGQVIDTARRARIASGTNLLLAEKVVGTGAQGRRAVTIEWDDVQQLTAWHYGLATATGVTIPDELLQTVGPQVRSWQALSPALAPQQRLRAGELAASWGVLSNAALVDLWGTAEASDEVSSADAGLASDLRTAYTAGTASERIAVMRRLWTEPTDARVRYARHILTARAATRIVPSADQIDAADSLVASMLSAGLDMPASRWRNVVPQGSDAWAMLLLADPNGRAPATAATVSAYRETASARKAQLFFAGMAGTGRINADVVEGLAQTLAVRIGDQNAWTRAIGQAAQQRQPATVLVLAGLGMQTTDWSAVSPVALFHITAALTAVGLEGEARMIAAEAIARA